MLQWYEVLQIASSLTLTDEDDAILWKLESKGIYTVSSLYAVVNFRGVTPVYIHALWKIKVPPRIHFFLWLVSHNKILTRDNLVKRQNLLDLSCLFCSETESCDHLFFECVVASVVWHELHRLIGLPVFPVNYENIAGLWLCDVKHEFTNVVSAAIMWILWKKRNDLCFNHKLWTGMQVLWRDLASTLSQWMVLLSADAKMLMGTLVTKLEHLARSPPPLIWRDLGRRTQ